MATKKTSKKAVKRRTPKARAAKKSVDKSNGSREPITLQLGENAARYKLQALQLKIDVEVELIRRPLVREFEEKLRARIDKEVSNSPKIKRMVEERNGLVKEVVEGLSVPDGYAIQNLMTDEGTALAVPK